MGRTRDLVSDQFLPVLEQHGQSGVVLAKEMVETPGVRLATMHRVKGLEFLVIFAVGVDRNHLPLVLHDQEEDPVLQRQHEQRERCLLYVAASRARDRLFVTGTGEPSPFIVEPAIVKTLSLPDLVPVPDPEPSHLSPEDTGNDKFSLHLDQLDLPTRFYTWAQREEIDTLGDLIRRSPAELMAARNMGRGTVAKTRQVVERLLDAKWEELSREVERSEISGTEYAATLGTGWDPLAAWLPPAFVDVSVREAKLPVRLQNYCERVAIKTLGQLVARKRQELIDADNLGGTTVTAGEVAIREFVGSHETRNRRWEEGLIPSWRQAMGELAAVERLVMTQRCALFHPQSTLEEVGELTGVTRERVRQLEAAAIEEMSHGGAWSAYLAARFEAATAEFGAARLEDLAKDSWWNRVDDVSAALQYLCEKLLDERWNVVSVADAFWLAKCNKKAVEKAQAEWQRFLNQVKLPAPLTEFDRVKASIAKKVGSVLADGLWQEVEDRLQIEAREGQATVVNAAGTKGRRLLAILRAAAAPMRVADITEQLGRMSNMPEEVLFFGGGRIGLAQHFPEFESWVTRLVPLALEVVRGQGSERQWIDVELLAELSDDVALPDWLDHWHLTAVLRQTQELQYLGRGRFALPGVVEDGERIELKDQMVALIRANGAPMDEELLRSRLREKIDIREATVNMAALRPPFVKMGDNHIGLMERDLPGGTEAIEEVGEHLEGLLMRKGKGLSVDELCVECAQLSVLHANWTREMLLSVLRADARFRLSRWGAVGLSEWESVRFPSRKQILERCFAAGDGRVTVDAAIDQVEAVYGERPDRATLWGPVQQLGAKIVGDWIILEVRKP